MKMKVCLVILVLLTLVGLFGSSIGGSSGATPAGIATITRPVAGSFSWVNQGAATLSTAAGGLSMTAPSLAGTNVRAQVMTPGGSTWKCDMLIAVTQGLSNPRGGGVIRESATGKMLSFGNGGALANQYVVDRWTNTTTFLTSAATLNLACNVASQGFWARAQLTATDVLWLSSPDGVNWTQQYTETKTTSFTTAPDQCGIMVDSEVTGNAPQVVTLLSFNN